MSSGVSPLRRHPLHNPSTLSLLDSQPGTPGHDDDENAPLIRPGDVERARYSSLRTSRNSDNRIFHLNGPGPDPESDVVKPSGQTSPTWAKAQYYIPSLQWIPNYSLSL